MDVISTVLHNRTHTLVSHMEVVGCIRYSIEYRVGARRGRGGEGCGQGLAS